MGLIGQMKDASVAAPCRSQLYFSGGATPGASDHKQQSEHQTDVDAIR
jgi:hypothetical protein